MSCRKIPDRVSVIPTSILDDVEEWRMQLAHFYFGIHASRHHSDPAHGPCPSRTHLCCEIKSLLIDSWLQPDPPPLHPSRSVCWWLCGCSDMNIFPGLAAWLGLWCTKFTLSPQVVLDHWVITATYFLVRLWEALYEFWIIIGIISKKCLGRLPVAFRTQTQPLRRNIKALACFEILPLLFH